MKEKPILITPMHGSTQSLLIFLFSKNHRGICSPCPPLALPLFDNAKKMQNFFETIRRKAKCKNWNVSLIFLMICISRYLWVRLTKLRSKFSMLRILANILYKHLDKTLAPNVYFFCLFLVHNVAIFTFEVVRGSTIYISKCRLIVFMYIILLTSAV